MYIAIIRNSGEFWTVTEESAKPFYNLKNAVSEAARMITKTPESETVFVEKLDYEILETYREEDEKEHPDWDFLPFGMMWYYDALNEHRNVAIASRKQIKESIRSLEIGKEMYR